MTTSAFARAAASGGTKAPTDNGRGFRARTSPRVSVVCVVPVKSAFNSHSQAILRRHEAAVEAVSVLEHLASHLIVRQYNRAQADADVPRKDFLRGDNVPLDPTLRIAAGRKSQRRAHMRRPCQGCT